MEIVQGRKDRQDDESCLRTSIHNISKSTPNSVIKYFSMLILALIVPSMIIIVYSIFLVGIKYKLLVAVDTNTTSTINTSLDRIFKLYC